MDISKASNFERFVFDLLDRDEEQLRDLWSKVDKGQGFDLSKTNYFGKIKNFGFSSSSSNHEYRVKIIKQMFEEFGLIIDTHTADGFKAAYDHMDESSDIKMIVLETALPTKFEETVIEAIGQKPKRPVGLEDIEKLPQFSVNMDNSIENVKKFIESH
jgi:threonine synthase